jgi:hypothetical protein
MSDSNNSSGKRDEPSLQQNYNTGIIFMTAIALVKAFTKCRERLTKEI